MTKFVNSRWHFYSSSIPNTVSSYFGYRTLCASCLQWNISGCVVTNFYALLYFLKSFLPCHLALPVCELFSDYYWTHPETQGQSLHTRMRCLGYCTAFHNLLKTRDISVLSSQRKEFQKQNPKITKQRKTNIKKSTNQNFFIPSLLLPISFRLLIKLPFSPLLKASLEAKMTRISLDCIL